MKWILLVVLAGCVQPGATSEPPAPWEGICEHLNHIQDRPLVVMEVPEKPAGYEDPKYFVEARMWPREENTNQTKQPDSAGCVTFLAEENTEYSSLARVVPYDHCYPLAAGPGRFIVEGEVAQFPLDAWKEWGAVCVERELP